MKMLKTTAARFVRSESGAITVDWVVLTAGLVALGLATIAVTSNGVEDLSGNVSADLASMQVNTNPFAGNGGGAGTAFERQQWDARNPGIYDNYSNWMAGFEDQQLLAHYNNMAQFAETTNTGHPYDTYHDEFWIARDEAVSRGLVTADAPIPGNS
jgi:Flp pilus assembly pilin Flp